MVLIALESESKKQLKILVQRRNRPPMTKARDLANFKLENIVDTGIEGTRIASGTTGQRGSTTGQSRFNTTIWIS